MNEHHLQTTRTARYFTYGALNSATREVWIVLHGYAQLAKDFIRSFETLDDGNRFIIAPEALNRFYARGFGGKPAAAWMTTEDREHEISDYIHYLDTVYLSAGLSQTDAKIIVCGFSQGVATASRWIHATSYRVDHFILYAGELARELQEPVPDRIKALPLTYITGTKDGMIDAEKRMQVEGLMKMLDARIILFDGGHEVKPEVIALLENM